MSNCGLAIFVKTPGYSAVKTRLAKDIGRSRAEELYQLSTRAVERTVREAAREHPNLFPFWAVSEEPALSEPCWSGFPRISQVNAHALGTRLDRVYSELLERFGAAILIGADSPQLGIDRLAEALHLLGRSSGSPRFVIGPSFDGGFYLFAGKARIERKIWEGIAYSTGSTCQDLIRSVSELGEIQSLACEHDFDTLEDLGHLSRAFALKPELSAEQEKFLCALEGYDNLSARLNPDRSEPASSSWPSPGSQRQRS